jgi:hypothetical protein
MKRHGLFGVLGLLALATLVVGREAPTDQIAAVAPASVSPRAAAAPAALPVLDLEVLERGRIHPIDTAVFAPKSWQPAAPPSLPAVAAPPPPAPPAAPPLPFVYLGDYLQDGTLLLFLAQGERNHAVKAGTVIDETWRVDRVSKAAIEFTYLPLNLPQSLPLPVRP